jgi:hypothetical protein
VRRTTSLATPRVLSSADSIAHVVSRSTQRVLTIWRRFAATGAPVPSIESPRARVCTLVAMPIGANALVFAIAASSGGDVSTGSRLAIRSRRAARNRRRRVSADHQGRHARPWHEACTAGPATGTRNAAVAPTLLNEGSFANRFFDMRSHDGAGFYRQHQVGTLVGGAASCRLNIHKSKKVCRGPGGHTAGPRPLRTRPTGTRP